MTHTLIDPPTAFHSRKQLQDFLAEWESHPDLPQDLQAAAAGARHDLAFKDELGIPDDPNPPPTQRIELIGV